MKISRKQILWVGLSSLVWWCGGVQVSAQPSSPQASPQATDGLQVLVTYHSLSGHTAEMAKSVKRGAESIPGTAVLLKTVGQVTADELFGSDAV
ncbi:MAG TPA: hypothetical protein PKZ24_07645, partial [Nitrospirales bacterium]|nr:hypothetical protein [Nitrospirales bacterium]